MDGTRAESIGDEVPPRSRRFDPDRRNHILRTALDVLVRHGVAGLTQRLVADAADVPLGSVTYHFSSRNDLVQGAFGLFVEQQNTIFENSIGTVRSREELLDALVALVDGGPSRGRAGVLGFELNLAAVRDPRLRELTAAWTAASRAVLGRLMDADAAADLDAYLEGLIMQALVSAQPTPTVVTRMSVARFLDAVPVRLRGPHD